VVAVVAVVATVVKMYERGEHYREVERKNESEEWSWRCTKKERKNILVVRIAHLGARVPRNTTDPLMGPGPYS
jgi:hypothetical protein